MRTTLDLPEPLIEEARRLLGFKSKTDPTGALDPALNPMRRLLGTGATFVARAYAGQLPHMTDMIERAMRHDGFSVVEVHTHCTNFYDDAFDGFNARKGGRVDLIDETKHDVTDINAAFRLASMETPGVFGVFYEVKDQPSKNAREADLMARVQANFKTTDGRALLQSAFNRLK